MENITFIIPTIGRNTLVNSLNCLKNQTISKWNAIVIFDGIKSNIENYDTRIKIIEVDKMGIGENSAGNVRNYGISLVKTKWIAFLDDDDLIDEDYIEIFYKELKLYPSIDVLIFRMDSNNRIIPKINTDNFYLCDVGISFIIKKDICDNNILFKPDGAEDFLFLNEIRENNYEIMISPYIKYFVKNKNLLKKNIYGNRVFINMDNNIIIFFGYLLLKNTEVIYKNE
jgi:glycosyltransferase involved in cell wall biosynthesis